MLIYATLMLFCLDGSLPRKYDVAAMENKPVTTLDPDALRSAMRGWSTGVTVVTSVHEGIRHGMTVNSFTSISLAPPIVSVSLQRASRTNELVTKSGMFGLTMLAADQSSISDLFAGRVSEAADRFEDLQTETLVTGSPLINGGLSWLDCRVIHTFDAGMNTLFIAEVLAARSFEGALPLVYYDRNYWQLSKK